MNVPWLFFGTLLGISTVAYLPMALIFGPLEWIGIGPFAAQASRILFYLVYFLAGTAIGAYGLDRSLLKADGPLARRWWAWLTAGLISFVVLLVLVIGGPTRPIIDAIAFTVSCAALVFGVTALFLALRDTACGYPRQPRRQRLWNLHRPLRVCDVAAILVAGYRSLRHREGDVGIRRNIDAQLGIDRRPAAHTGGGEGHLDGAGAPTA